MPYSRNELPHAPALALLLFAAGALLRLAAPQFGVSFDAVSGSALMWALVLAAAALQLSVSALLLLPVSALIFGAAATAEARSLLSPGEGGPEIGGLTAMLLVPLFVLLFCRGMRQGALLRRSLLEGRLLQRRELLFSFVIMIAAILLFWLVRLAILPH